MAPGTESALPHEVSDVAGVWMSAPPGSPAGHWRDACWLPFFGVLAGKQPGDFCRVAGVVDLLVAGCGGGAAEVLPAQAVGEEDPD